MYVCDICGKEVKTLKGLSNHKRTHDPAFKLTKKVFECNKCGKEITGNRGHLVSHQRNCDGKGTSLDKKKANKGPVKCPKCGKRSALERLSTSNAVMVPHGEDTKLRSLLAPEGAGIKGLPRKPLKRSEGEEKP
jgi:DNA-directed RNA polymerase subunit RPC12/RpoP